MVNTNRLEKEIERAEEKLSTLEPGTKEHAELSLSIERLRAAESNILSEKERKRQSQNDWLKVIGTFAGVAFSAIMTYLGVRRQCDARMEQVRELKVIKNDQGLADRDVLNYR